MPPVSTLEVHLDKHEVLVCCDHNVDQYSLQHMREEAGQEKIIVLELIQADSRLV